MTTPRLARARLVHALWLGLLVASVLPALVSARGPEGPQFARSIDFAPGLGYLNEPLGIAISPAEDGRIFVADAGNARIHVLTSLGHPLGVWGGRGRGKASLWRPTDVAVSPDGRYVYVVDQLQQRIKRYEPHPECFVPNGRTCFTADSVHEWGLPGVGNGAFVKPTGIAVGPDGSVYVSDEMAGVVQVFDGRGSFLRALGSEDGPARLVSPMDVEIGPRGQLWVADRDNDRIVTFGPDGEVSAVIAAQGLHGPTGLAVAPDGGYAILDADVSYGVPRLWRFDGDRRLVWQPTAFGGGTRMEHLDLQGTAVLRDGSVLLADRTGPEYSLFVAPPGERPELIPLTFRGRDPRQFDAPKAVAIDEHFTVVSDCGNNRVILLDALDQPMRIFGGAANPLGDMRSPRGVAVWRHGRKPEDAIIFIADPDAHAVHLVTPAGRIVDRWGLGGASTGTDGLSQPQAVAVGKAADGETYVYVADTGNHRIVRRTTDGQYVNAIGSYGTDRGEMTYPVSVAVGPGGSVYVLDLNQNRVQAFAPDGPLVDEWRTPGDGRSTDPGDLWLPKAVAADSQFVYVLENDARRDARNHIRIQVFDPAGTYPGNVFAIFADGGPGAAPGRLWDAYGLAVAPDGRIAVADTGNNRVEMYQWPGEGPTPIPSATSTDPPPATDLPRPSTPLPSAEPTDAPTATATWPTVIAPTADVQSTPTARSGRSRILLPFMLRR